MKAPYVIALLAIFASGVSCQNMTLMSGQVIAINELYKASNYSCCIPRSTLGDYTPIVRMDGSKGQYYVTADPDCKTAPIQSEAYPASYEAIWACGKCAGGKCPTVDGGLYVALPGDWCVDQNNKQDPNTVCSTQAPVCDEGYSGKCIAVPTDATQAVSGPSITLQSGQIVDMNKLAQEYQGQCCLPRTVINDFTPIIRLDNSNGNYFVSNDPSCNGPITNDLFPAMFEYIHVCDQCPPGGCYQDQTTVINGGITLVQQGGSCDPYNYYSAGCWGAAPMCSFGINQCIGIPYYANRYYNDYCYSTFDCGGGGWSGWGWGDYGYYRPVWWRPCYPIYRPGWWRPPIIRPHPPGPWWPIRPCPSDWRPGRLIPGWRPGNRPIDWKPDRDVWHRPRGFKPGRGDEHIIRPGDAIVGRFGKPGQGVNQQIRPPKPDSLAGRRAGPGVTPVVRNPDTVTGGAGAIAGTPGVRSGVPQGPRQGNRPSDIFQGRSIPGRSNGQTGRQDQGADGTTPVVDTRAPGIAGGNDKGQGGPRAVGQQGDGTRAGGVGGNKGQGPEVQVPNKGQGPEVQVPGAGNGDAGQSGPRQPGRDRGNPLLPGITPGNPTITENGPGRGNQVGAGGRNQVGGNLAAGGQDNVGNLFGPGGGFYGRPRSTTAPSFTQQPQQVFRPSTPRTREFNPREFGGGGRGRGAQPLLYPSSGVGGLSRGNSFGGGPRGGGGRGRGFGK